MAAMNSCDWEKIVENKGSIIPKKTGEDDDYNREEIMWKAMLKGQWIYIKATDEQPSEIKLQEIGEMRRD